MPIIRNFPTFYLHGMNASLWTVRLEFCLIEFTSKFLKSQFCYLSTPSCKQKIGPIPTQGVITLQTTLNHQEIITPIVGNLSTFYLNVVGRILWTVRLTFCLIESVSKFLKQQICYLSTPSCKQKSGPVPTQGVIILQMTPSPGGNMPIIGNLSTLYLQGMNGILLDWAANVLPHRIYLKIS